MAAVLTDYSRTSHITKSWSETRRPKNEARAGITRAEPATVYFPSADGQTKLVGYLFAPSTPGPHPAVVMLHGRAGPYSANDNEDCTRVARGVASECNALTLSKRHMQWGEYWAAHGYVALLPDSFGPRDKGHGFGRGTHDDADRDDDSDQASKPTRALRRFGSFLSQKFRFLG